MNTVAKKTIDKATSDKISFITYIVPAFADAYKMNVQDAFFYLKKIWWLGVFKQTLVGITYG